MILDLEGEGEGSESVVQMVRKAWPVSVVRRMKGPSASLVVDAVGRDAAALTASDVLGRWDAGRGKEAGRDLRAVQTSTSAVLGMDHVAVAVGG